MDAPLLPTLVALVPLVVLGGLVFGSRVSLGIAAWAAALIAAGLALTLFGLGAVGLAVGAAKGFWTGVWILLIVVPALLLFEVAEMSGALARLADQLSSLAPTPGRRLLLIGWIFPSFLQGVAGFGIPVVIAAPMLIRAGLGPVAAISAVMIGYHWSVTFGSMGSSFFVAAGTAGLDAEATTTFAVQAAGLLAINALAAALLLLRREGREAWEAVLPALLLGVVMGGVLLATVVVQPTLGSTAAGLAGLIAAAAVLPRGRSAADWPVLLRAAAPYLLLTAAVVVAFGVPPVRDFLGAIPEIAPSFAATEAAFGHTNEAVDAHQPLRPLLHPAPYLLVAAAIGLGLYHRARWLQPERRRMIIPAWLRRSQKIIVSLLGLTTLAGIMVDAGMIEALAEALTAGLGAAYVAVAPVLGAIGTIMTGSTTASNALLSPLQERAAEQLDVAATALLAGQTAGGNVGNALTPINALVAAVAVGCAGQEGAILRRAARDAIPLLALVIAGTVGLVLLG